MMTTSPRCERRPDEHVDVVGLVGGEEQRLGTGGHVLAVQHQVADLLAERGAARLTGDRDVAPRALERLAEQRHLGGLARAVAALEDDEESVGHAASLGHATDAAGTSHDPNITFVRF